MSSTVFKPVVPYQLIKNRKGCGEEGCPIADEWEYEVEKVDEEEGGVDDNVDLGISVVVNFTYGKVQFRLERTEVIGDGNENLNLETVVIVCVHLL